MVSGGFFIPKGASQQKAEFKFSEDDLLPNELKIFKALQSWRKNLPQKLDWSAFRICHNSHLIAIAKANPQNTTDLEQVFGFGKARTEKYGDDILFVLNAL